jgi:hypothetical protein
MRKFHLARATAAALSACAVLVSTTLADDATIAPVPVSAQGAPRPGNAINVGDAMNISVTATQGAGELFKMDYPGNGIPVIINARIQGLTNTDWNTVGFDVYDSLNGPTPVEHLTLGSNMFNQDPQLMEFVYTAFTPGPVTFQFFNWSNKPLTLQVMPVQLAGPALMEAGPSIPGSATAIGLSGVAGVRISRG